jgi:bifunctional non-homologous end joining protein LigD
MAAARPYWKGQLKLSLVSFPVDLYSATTGFTKISFHQIHQPSGKRVRHTIETYRRKRDFKKTPEPAGKVGTGGGRKFIVQKHAATRLHYDLRLELDGVLLSWAVTRGPSADPADKRLAVRTEDHPIDYGNFEGVIPKGEYGGGTVMLWDRGTWEPLHDPHEGLEQGKLHFRLDGERMKGGWALVRMRGKPHEKRENWLLIKEDDEMAARQGDLTKAHDTSVKTGRSMDEIAGGKPSRRSQSKRTRKTGKAAAMPEPRKPQLATLVDDPPEGRDWLHELKYDGYRCLIAIGEGTVHCFTRNGLDWTDRFASLVSSALALPVESALIDGEVVVLDEEGHASFAALQQAMKSKAPMTFFAFDLLQINGEDTSRLPQIDRKARLEEIVGTYGEQGAIYYSEHVQGEGAKVFRSLCEQGQEGIVSKRADAPYRSGRSRSWLKVKCGKHQEFVIGGWTPSDRRTGFKSLLVGTYHGKDLVYAGRVGTGFDAERLRELSARMKPLARKTSPFSGVPRETARTAKWVEPKLVAEIAYTEFTDDGILRHPSFIALREDKDPRSVVRERPKEAP